MDLAPELPWTPLPMRDVAPRTADQRRATVTATLEWAASAGAPLHGVTARVDAGGNVSMYATRDIAQGAPIFALPRRLMIVDRDHAALATWLALAAGDPASPWRAYLDDLPSHLPELPVFRTGSDVAALVGTTAYARSAANRRDLLAAHAILPTPLPLADFAWAWSVVRSRAYQGPGTLEPHLALMPIVDLFDHGHGDTTWTYDPIDARFEITAERAIVAGEPVTFTYGDFGNGRLLAHYGFTLPDNPFAEAPLELEHLVLVASRIDHRFVHALSIAREHATSEEGALALLADAAGRGIAVLAGPAPITGDPTWDTSCTRVRVDESTVLAQYAALAERTGPLYHAYVAALDEER